MGSAPGAAASGPALDPAALARHARSGPRYTSYPTAPRWRAPFPEAAWERALSRLSGPAGVYVHVPFCAERCSYCACNMVVARQRDRAPDAGDRYLDALERVVERLALPGPTAEATRIHLGGGTPTWLSPAQLDRLFSILAARLHLRPGGELSCEADPGVTDDDHLDALVARGLTRLSLGVQSFDPVVLEAVGRDQTAARIQRLVGRARALGVAQLNLDLMYGLPHQTPERFARTLAQIIAIRPERLAVFGYAHVPWVKPHQRQIPTQALPGPTERARLALMARSALTGAGYVAIGLDHFALPDDPLAQAARARSLRRDFMGYTVRRSALIGLGMSAISCLPDLYAQQHSRLSDWRRAADSGGPMIERGIVLSPEDQLRRDVITALMCNLEVRYAEIERDHGVDFQRHFRAELKALAAEERAGLAERRVDRLVVTERGRLLVRNVAMAFDQYLASGRYSRTV